jgi:hypothetical protein
MSWQPIETAPKDTAILVYGFGPSVAHFNTAYGRWIGYGSNTPDTISLNEDNGIPILWMPLPEMPSKDEILAARPPRLPTPARPQSGA